jgi:hypothetical protein
MGKGQSLFEQAFAGKFAENVAALRDLPLAAPAAIGA